MATKVVNGEHIAMTDAETDEFLASLPKQPTAAEALALERASMVISPMQGILTLGKAAWDQVMAYRVSAAWQEQVVIDSAQDWQRNSQNIAFFGYLLGYSDTQMDDLFRNAAKVTA